jgi:hypothetical protein
MMRVRENQMQVLRPFDSLTPAEGDARLRRFAQDDSGKCRSFDSLTLAQDDKP